MREKFPRKKELASLSTDGRCWSTVSSFWTRPLTKKRIRKVTLGETYAHQFKPIGQFWLPKNQTEVAPTKTGICLTPTEYSKLKACGVLITGHKHSFIEFRPLPGRRRRRRLHGDRRFCSGTELCCFLCLQIGSHESAKINTGES